MKLVRFAVKMIYFEVGSRVFELGGRPVGGIRWGLYVLLIPGPAINHQIGIHEVQASDHEVDLAAAEVPIANDGHVMRTSSSRRRWRRKLQQQLGCQSVNHNAPVNNSMSSCRDGSMAPCDSASDVRQIGNDQVRHHKPRLQQQH